MAKNTPPNVLFVFADQWRAQATGYAGDPNVKTPNLDHLADHSLRFTHAVSNCPVCSPWRATLMTGQYPLTHGVFVNDVPVSSTPRCLAECFREAGYDTAYIGKWHIDGHGRSIAIPPERRKGFQFWKARECTHDYTHSFYYGDGPERLWWQGYDAVDQTRACVEYLRGHGQERPFLMMLSWGPPHDPYQTAPEEYRRLYDPSRLTLRPNVPRDSEEKTRKDLAGYYAHCSVLDDCVAALLKALEETGLAEKTILVFTSDHGDMVGSQGHTNKQRPWDESILVPMLLQYPALFGSKHRTIDTPINAPDLMPTLLGLAGIEVPASVEGKDFSGFLQGESEAPDRAALIELPACFHQFAYHNGGRDWRGLRSERYTYVIDHQGPWLLYDNLKDPFQLENLVDREELSRVRADLDQDLRKRMSARGDEFLPGQEYIRRAGYPVNDRGDPVYKP